MSIRIEHDDMGIAPKLSGCLTVTDVRDRLADLFPAGEWWLYEGPFHVRLHRAPPRGRIARLFERAPSEPVFLAREVPDGSSCGPAA
jgi:hypothetical protein